MYDALRVYLPDGSDGTPPPSEQAKDLDTKAAKRARDKARDTANSGVGMLQRFFFDKKAPAPAPAPPAATARSAAAAAGGDGRSNGHGHHSHGHGHGNGHGGHLGDGRRRSRFGNGAGAGVDEETYRLLEGAVPTEFAGRSWEGYLHHVDFIVALMHVGTSLIPKSLMKVRAVPTVLVLVVFWDRGREAGAGGLR